MNHLRLASCTLIAVLTAGVFSGVVIARQKDGDDKKVSLALRANPPVGFTPLAVRVTVDVRGGADDNVDLYCPSVEWSWGDDVISEREEDCDPYEAGKTSIQRRYTGQHTYKDPGTYRLTLKLKQKNRVVATQTATIEVRPGAGTRDPF